VVLTPGLIVTAGLGVAQADYFLIRDQGNHLRHYWTNEQKIGAWNISIQGFILDQEEVASVSEPGYRAPIPRFCRRLVLLSIMFAIGFVGTFLLMSILMMSRVDA